MNEQQYEMGTGEVVPIRGEEFALAQQHEHAAMDVQVATAQRLGRNIQQFQADLESWSCNNQEIAEECTYVLTKGGTRIVGPSIRFAELLQASYRHIVVDAFIEDEKHGHVIVGCMARDLFRNIAVRTRVRRNILKRDGSRYSADVIQSTVNAGASLAIRNAIIRLVPKALWLPVWLKSRDVATGGAKGFGERLGVAFQTVATYGITEEQVLAHLGKESRGNMDTDDLILMRNKVRAIRAGEVDADDAFPPQDDDADDASDLAREREERLQKAAKASKKKKARKAKDKAPEQEAPSEEAEGPAEPAHEEPEEGDVPGVEI